MAYSAGSSSEDDVQDAISQPLRDEELTRTVLFGDRAHEETEEEEENGPGGTDAIEGPVVTIASRAYQLEMLEASLKENVIVAMDTGSGKTQVAMLRIEAELRTMASNQVIWFLAPTVSLCIQQGKVVTAQIPQVQSKVIVGADNVDSWKAATWHTALENVKIVISTHQILLDALLHGFFTISSLALLVFDEAHHCINDHPYSRIMKEFYWESKAKREPVPYILGLTASPVLNSSTLALQKLERTLDAVCRSPTRHREELLANSHRPTLVHVPFRAESQLCPTEYSGSITKLVITWNKLDIMEDPWIVSLSNEKSDRAYRQLEKALTQKKTYIQDTMKNFCRRSIEMAANLGCWAADWYIFETIRRFLVGVGQQGAATESWRDAEVVYLARIFQSADIRPPPPAYKQSQLSDKVQQLIKVLLTKGSEAKGIVFAQERATAAVLRHVLAIHPAVNKTYRMGVMIGTSFVPGVKRDFLDLPQVGGQSTLDDFRGARINLLVATSVMEEGIDVPACNLIICLDKPVNLKSFIQRRGRARMRESHVYIFVEEDGAPHPTDWEELEAEMKHQYENEMREHQTIEALEDTEELDYPELHVESTGARLTIKDAKSHLQHFCATLTSRKYVNQLPDYMIQEQHESARPGAPILLKATVVLPISVPRKVRQATSSRPWFSERHACMDAAFQAYAALHRAGLLDDHLLPLQQSLDRGIEARPGMMTVRALANPWLGIAQAWAGDQGQLHLHRRTLRVYDVSGSDVCQFELALPRAIPDLKPMAVWWDYDSQVTIRLDSDVEMANEKPDVVSSDATGVGGHTHVLLLSAYCHRKMVIKNDCVIRLLSLSGSLSTDQIGSAPFTPDLCESGCLEYLVRDERRYADRQPYFFDKYLPSKPALEVIQKAYKGFETEPAETSYLSVRKWPRNLSFCRPDAPQQPPTTKQYVRVIPAETTTVDSIPSKYAQFGLLIPALIYYIEIYILAADLSQSLLKRLNLSDVSKVADAICATSARTPTNYERVEFLGDSILKTCITVNVAATHLHMPEGLLSLLKDRLVSNDRLRRAAGDSGLDQFIVTQQLTLKGWRAPYISDLLGQDAQQVPGERTLSTKTLADVVEALIGVSYMDGGISKALDCISLFIPESQVKSFQAVRDTLFHAAEPKNMALPMDLVPLEALLEHTFQEKALLVEAVTHPSYNIWGTFACFDRLEFIGDAILDFIVVEELYAVDPPLANFQMHLLRTVLVNADILGFLVMELSYQEQRFDIVRSDGVNTDGIASSCGSGPATATTTAPALLPTEVEIPLWSFMRQASAELRKEREATRARHAALRTRLLAAIRSGTHYPWALLARLHAPKCYSDLFEALVGAVWVDAGPGFAACRRVVERAGILPFLRRMLRDGVHALHPKEELGRLAGRERVVYRVTEVEAAEEGPGAAGNGWACEVLVGDRSVVVVDGCLFREEAKVTAATRACQIIKDGRGVLG